MISQSRFNDQPCADEEPNPATLGADHVARLRLQLNELQAYILQQWAVRTDRVVLSIRRLAVLAAVGVVGLLALAAWLITAVVLLLDGAVGGLTSVFGGRVWLASLVVGAAALTFVILGVGFVYAGWSKASKQKTKQKYERRQREQRRRFGHSAHDRASQL